MASKRGRGGASGAFRWASRGRDAGTAAGRSWSARARLLPPLPMRCFSALPAFALPAANKGRLTLGLPVGAVMNCADNTGAKNLYIIAVSNTGARLNRLPAASELPPRCFAPVPGPRIAPRPTSCADPARPPMSGRDCPAGVGLVRGSWSCCKDEGRGGGGASSPGSQGAAALAAGRWCRWGHCTVLWARGRTIRWGRGAC